MPTPCNGWTWRRRVDETLQRLRLPAEGTIGTRSGGTRKRVALAQALVMKLEVHPRRWIILGALISGIGFASVAGVQQGWQLPAAYALAAFGMGFVFPSFQALAADAVEAHEQGAAAGTVAAAQGLGMVAGPMLGTLLYRGGPSLPYLLVGALLLLLCALAAAHRMKETP